MIDTKLFLENLADAIEDVSVPLTEQTNFQNLSEWSSIAALMTIAMIFSEYSVQITGEELIQCVTASDLINLVESKAKIIA